jgi:hypothetical protein
MYIVRLTAVEFTPGQKINKFRAYHYVADTGMPKTAILLTAEGGKAIKIYF